MGSICGRLSLTQEQHRYPTWTLGSVASRSNKFSRSILQVHIQAPQIEHLSDSVGRDHAVSCMLGPPSGCQDALAWPWRDCTADTYSETEGWAHM